MNFVDLTIYYAVHTTVYVYLLLFIKLSLSKINAIKLSLTTELVVETLNGNNYTRRNIFSL
jgi:hypothetical protein